MGDFQRRGPPRPYSGQYDPTGFAGVSRGPDGASQGGIGSLVGQTFGAQDGMDRARVGGMEPFDDVIARLLAAVFPSQATRTKKAGGDLGPPRPEKGPTWPLH